MEKIIYVVKEGLDDDGFVTNDYKRAKRMAKQTCADKGQAIIEHRSASLGISIDEEYFYRD